MRKNLLIILLVLAVSIVSVQATSRILPSRCIFSPEISCLDFLIDSVNNQVNFTFRNNLDNKSEFAFIAWVSGNEPSSAVRCLCNGEASCSLNPREKGKVECNFPQGAIQPEIKMKFELQGNYSLLNNPLPQTEIRGELYGPTDGTLHREYQNAYSNHFIAYMAVTVIFLIIYIGLIIFFGKTKKLKDWIKSSWRKYFIVALILFIIINFAIMQVTSYYFDLTEAIRFPIYFFIISLILTFPIGIIIGIISHLKSKKNLVKK